ncbi:hypothetical protein ACJJI4_01440 [Microbulbifer sp. TRSA002]|uniref:hypothetical protein n=1 Tax=Microbulbifer sp. TRSA002 TaxID=3243382 RepID=UPI00403A3D5F
MFRLTLLMIGVIFLLGGCANNVQPVDFSSANEEDIVFISPDKSVNVVSFWPQFFRIKNSNGETIFKHGAFAPEVREYKLLPGKYTVTIKCSRMLDNVYALPSFDVEFKKGGDYIMKCVKTEGEGLFSRNNIHISLREI